MYRTTCHVHTHICKHSHNHKDSAAFLWVCIWAVRPMAVMHTCILCLVYMRVPASVWVCICMCVYWLPNKGSRKRKRLDGLRRCLFIHYPAALVVSGGHGNTCPGPFSTGLFVACFGPAKSFSSHLLCFLFTPIPCDFILFVVDSLGLAVSVILSFIFGKNFHMKKIFW